jgi:hypothetical protein
MWLVRKGGGGIHGNSLYNFCKFSVNVNLLKIVYQVKKDYVILAHCCSGVFMPRACWNMGDTQQVIVEC